MELSDWLTSAQQITAIIGATSIFVWVSAWWLSNQFSATRHLVDTKIENLEKTIVDKLEYHERHDDDRFLEMRKTAEGRFNEVKNDIWDIRVRNAAQDGTLPLPKSKK